MFNGLVKFDFLKTLFNSVKKVDHWWAIVSKTCLNLYSWKLWHPSWRDRRPLYGPRTWQWSVHTPCCSAISWLRSPAWPRIEGECILSSLASMRGYWAAISLWSTQCSPSHRQRSAPAKWEEAYPGGRFSDRGHLRPWICRSARRRLMWRRSQRWSMWWWCWAHWFRSIVLSWDPCQKPREW